MREEEKKKKVKVGTEWKTKKNRCNGSKIEYKRGMDQNGWYQFNFTDLYKNIKT